MTTPTPKPILVLVDISPSGLLEISPPNVEHGTWWIDIRHKGFVETIGWKTSSGWQFYDPNSPGFGYEAPRSTTKCIGKVIQEVRQLTAYLRNPDLKNAVL